MNENRLNAIAIHELLTKEVRDVALELFQLLDKNGNGVLDAGDFRSYIANSPSFVAQRALWTELLSRFDFNGDARIDCDEFLRGFVSKTLQSEMTLLGGDGDEQGSLKDRFESWVEKFNNAVVDKIAAFKAMHVDEALAEQFAVGDTVAVVGTASYVLGKVCDVTPSGSYVVEGRSSLPVGTFQASQLRRVTVPAFAVGNVVDQVHPVTKRVVRFSAKIVQIDVADDSYYIDYRGTILPPFHAAELQLAVPSGTVKSSKLDEIQGLMTKIALSGPGRLESSPRAIVQTNLLNEEATNSIDRLFRTIDKDSNGYLNEADFRFPAATQIEKRRIGQFWESLCRRFDVSGDNRVDRAEFSRGFVTQTYEQRGAWSAPLTTGLGARQLTFRERFSRLCDDFNINTLHNVEDLRRQYLGVLPAPAPAPVRAAPVPPQPPLKVRTNTMFIRGQRVLYAALNDRQKPTKLVGTVLEAGAASLDYLVQTTPTQESWLPAAGLEKLPSIGDNVYYLAIGDTIAAKIAGIREVNREGRSSLMCLISFSNQEREVDASDLTLNPQASPPPAHVPPAPASAPAPAPAPAPVPVPGTIKLYDSVKLLDVTTGRLKFTATVIAQDPHLDAFTLEAVDDGKLIPDVPADRLVRIFRANENVVYESFTAWGGEDLIPATIETVHDDAPFSMPYYTIRISPFQTRDVSHTSLQPATEASGCVIC